MNPMNPIVKALFDSLSGLTTPLRGHRTALGAISAVALAVYAAVEGNYTLATLAVSLFLSTVGLRPDGPAEPQPQPVPVPNPDAPV